MAATQIAHEQPTPPTDNDLRAVTALTTPEPHDGRPNDWLDLVGARVFVAGAGGLGGACARAFLGAGAKVHVADLDGDRARSIVAGTLPDATMATAADLTDRAAVRGAFEAMDAAWGGVDVCVHALGINVRTPVLECDDADWLRTLEVNLTTAWYVATEAGRRMVATGNGRIIFFSSVSGLLAHRDHGPYAASKGGLNQMLRVMAAEWADKGVTVNAIAPGYVETDLTRAYLERDDNRARLEHLVPAGRLGTLDEVTGPVLFLASRQARYVTGHVLYVDGGRTLV